VETKKNILQISSETPHVVRTMVAAVGVMATWASEFLVANFTLKKTPPFLKFKALE
jgi:hypothetical protein